MKPKDEGWRIEGAVFRWMRCFSWLLQQTLGCFAAEHKAAAMRISTSKIWGHGSQPEQSGVASLRSERVAFPSGGVKCFGFCLQVRGQQSRRLTDRLVRPWQWCGRGTSVLWWRESWVNLADLTIPSPHGQELCVVTERIRSPKQALGVSFLWRVDDWMDVCVQS